MNKPEEFLRFFKCILSKTIILPFLLVYLVFSCNSSPNPDDTDRPRSSESGRPSSALSLLQELQNNVELGSPASLVRAADLLRGQEIFEQEKALGAIAAALIRYVYSDFELHFPVLELSAGAPYQNIIRNAERNQYTAPSSGSRDFLEHILPFIVFYIQENSGRIDMDRMRNAIPHLNRAVQLNNASVLPHLFLGFALERTQEHDRAIAAYRRALELDRSCYPAAVGLARLYYTQRRYNEALTLLTAVPQPYNGTLSVQKQLARVYAELGEYRQADALITEILRQNNRDGEFLLLRAKILLDQGFFQQAQQPLDIYTSIDNRDRRYILLRARLQAEGLRNRDAAINLLRPLFRSDPLDSETAIYLASLLMESARSEDMDEGRQIVSSLLANAQVSPEALSLAAADSVMQENWREAKVYLDRLLPIRRNTPDLLNAWRTERALGNNAAALSYGRELYNRDNTNDDAVNALVISLIDTGRQAEAGRIIEQRLASVPGGAGRSQYFFLRSRTRTDENTVLNDLRSALFEDPRNLDALIAMFEIYHRRRDERRAVYYLRQALAIAPDHPQLRRFELEYRDRMNN